MIPIGYEIDPRGKYSEKMLEIKLLLKTYLASSFNANIQFVITHF